MATTSKNNVYESDPLTAYKKASQNAVAKQSADKTEVTGATKKNALPANSAGKDQNSGNLKNNLGLVDTEDKIEMPKDDPSDTNKYDEQYVNEISQNYKNYFNTTVQNAILKSYADKYLANSLKSEGLTSAGYGTTASNQINNSVINANQNALEAYNEANIQSESDAIDRMAIDNTDLSNYASSATSVDDINEYFSNYGYKIGEDGKVYYNDGSEASAYIQSQYKYAVDNLGSDDTGWYNDLSEIGKTKWNPEKANGAELSDKFEWEFNKLQNAYNRGEISKGDVIALHSNHWGKTVYLKYTSNGWHYATEEEYSNSSNKKTFTDNKENKWDGK